MSPEIPILTDPLADALDKVETAYRTKLANRFDSYYSFLDDLGADRELIEATRTAFALFINHCVETNTPHLIEQLFTPQTLPGSTITPAHLSELYSHEPLTHYFSWYRDRRNLYWRTEISNTIRASTSSLTFITGGMFSGKSNLLLGVIDELTEGGEYVVEAYVPSLIGEGRILTREPARSIPAKPIELEDLVEIRDRLAQSSRKSKTLIAIDEVPFIVTPRNGTESLVRDEYESAYRQRCEMFMRLLEEIRLLGVNVILCGLHSNVSSEQFPLTRHIREVIYKQVLDEQLLLEQAYTKMGKTGRADPEASFILDDLARSRLIEEIRIRTDNISYRETRESHLPAGTEYVCSALYGYYNKEGILAIAPATETARIALGILPNQEGIVDLVWPIVLPTREERRSVTALQRVNHKLVAYHSKPPYCHIWSFLKDYHPELHRLLLDRQNSKRNMDLLKAHISKLTD